MPEPLSKWFGKFQYQYSTFVQVLAEPQYTTSSNDSTLRFNWVNINVVTPNDLLRLFQDYEKHVEDTLRL